MLKRSNQVLLKSKAEVCDQRKVMEQQNQNFNEKSLQLEFVINGIKAKAHRLEKPSAFEEMFRKSEKRRKDEVKELTKEIEQLRSILTDPNQKLDSLKQFNKVLKPADTSDNERSVKVRKDSFETGTDEICCKINIRKDREKKYTVVIEKVGLAIDRFEKCALREKDSMKELLKCSERFQNELQEAKTKIEQLDSDN